MDQDQESQQSTNDGTPLMIQRQKTTSLAILSSPSPDCSTTTSSFLLTSPLVSQPCTTTTLLTPPIPSDGGSYRPALGQGTSESEMSEYQSFIPISQSSPVVNNGGVTFSPSHQELMHLLTPQPCGSDGLTSVSPPSTDKIRKLLTLSPSPTLTNRQSRSIPPMEETPPLGEEHYSNCGSKPPTPRLETSMLSCPSRSSTPLDSPDEETSWAHSQLLKGTYWAMTTWENSMNAESILAELAKMGNAVLSIVGSVPHTC